MSLFKINSSNPNIKQRYINRESHSLGQNINDFKDFDYNIFMDGLKMVFLEMGYSEHYKKMMKLK